MSDQLLKNDRRAGVTLSQACMFISVITSLAAVSCWLAFQIRNMNASAELDQINQKREQLVDRSEKLKNHERKLNNLIALEDEASLTQESIQGLKNNIIEQHEGRSEYNGTLEQLLQLLELEIRRLASKQQQLLLMKQDLNNKLSIQKSRLKKFKDIHSNQLNQLTSFKSDLDTKREQLEQQISTVQDQTNQRLNKLKNELKQLKENHSDKIQKLDIELSGIKTSISELQQRQEEQFVTIDESDGKVLRTESENKSVYINIGENDRVKAGMIFGVYANSEDNERTRIGMVKVKNVFSGYSRCKIISEKDPSQPVLQDYEISNPFFSTKKPKRIGLVGTFTNENSVKKAIRSMGSIVQNDLSPELDYVITGRDHEGSDRFSKARDLGLLFSKFDHFRAFVK